MKSLAIALALLTGCGAVRRHPFAVSGAANIALVVGAGVCVAECGSPARGISEGVLVGELALASTLGIWLVSAFVSYATQSHN